MKRIILESSVTVVNTSGSTVAEHTNSEDAGVTILHSAFPPSHIRALNNPLSSIHNATVMTKSRSNPLTPVAENVY